MAQLTAADHSLTCVQECVRPTFPASPRYTLRGYLREPVQDPDPTRLRKNRAPHWHLARAMARWPRLLPRYSPLNARHWESAPVAHGVARQISRRHLERLRHGPTPATVLAVAHRAIRCIQCWTLDRIDQTRILTASGEAHVDSSLPRVYLPGCGQLSLATRPLAPTAQPALPGNKLSELYESESNCRHVAPLSLETSEPEGPTTIQVLRFESIATAERYPRGEPCGGDQSAPLSPVIAILRIASLGLV